MKRFQVNFLLFIIHSSMDEINIEKTVLFDVVSFMNEVRFSCSDKRSDEIINLGKSETMNN